MIFDYSLINKISVFIIIILGLGLGFWVYFSNRKNKLNKTFLIFSVFLVLWTSYPFFFNLPNVSHQMSLLLVRLAYGTTALFFIPFYSFIKLLLREYKKYPFFDKFVFLLAIFLFIFSSFTSWHVQNIKTEEWGVAPIFGDGKIIYFGIISFLVAIIIWLLFTKYPRLSDKEKLMIQYVFLGFFIFILLNSIFNIFFPVWKDTLKYYPLGNYSTIFLLGFTAYAIVKRELFGIRVVLTTLFVGIIAILLFLNAFVLTKELPLKIIQGVILVVFLIFGYSLIRSVLQEIKYRQQLQEAYQELKKLDEAKSEFISIASHQLRTPLTAIKGYISMLLEGTYGAFAEKAKTPLENVYKSSERLIKLVNDLLSISKIEAGKMELEIEKASLEDIIREVIEEFKVEAEKKKIYLKWERPQRPLPSIFVDIDKIRQVVLNMVDNAIRYTNKGGITIISEVKNLDIEIRISDTGEGMTRGEISKIFESFSRGGAGSRFYTEGVGLGLYVAKKFVEIHKGRIWAESQGRGKGSNFYIQLPISQETIEDIIKTM